MSQFTELARVQPFLRPPEAHRAFSLLNFYAIEILESLGWIDPPETEIKRVADLLAHAEWTSDPCLQQLQAKKSGLQSHVFLFESSRAFAIPHFLMLSNLGFVVHHFMHHSSQHASIDDSESIIFSRNILPGEAHLLRIKIPGRTLQVAEVPLSFQSIVRALFGSLKGGSIC